MIRIIKNKEQIHPIRNSMKCPKYLLEAKGKDGKMYYAKIGIGEILGYVRLKIKGTF